MGWSLVIAACDLSGTGDTEGGDTEGGAEGQDTHGVGSGDESPAPSGGEDGGIPSNDYCADVSAWDMEMLEFEEDVLVLVNEARAAGASCGGDTYGPTGPLAMNPALRCAARVHSKDMSERNFFDHVNPDGEDPFVRMGYAGYTYFTAGENIAAGQQSPAMVMDSWMNSPGHCSNIMNPDFEDLGVGAFAGEGGAYSLYWTQAFGAQ